MTPSAPRTYAKVGGHNRPNAAKAVREVETVECPGGGLHRLVKSGETVVCAGCGETWAALDGAINSRAGWL